MDAGKPEIRQALHAMLRATGAGERASWSAAMRENLLAAAHWKKARTVMLFAALRFEPDLMPLLELETGKKLVFPALDNEVIVAREVGSPGDLETAGTGIREPAAGHCPPVPVEEIDLIMVPGLGFGRDGSRLGRGKGHYDRFLSTLSASAFLCGVCFRCQVLDMLPAEGHDIPVHALLTESGWEDLRIRRPSVP